MRRRLAVVGLALLAAAPIAWSTGVGPAGADPTPPQSPGYLALPIPNPAAMPAAASESMANAVSCPSSGACVAVGQASLTTAPRPSVTSAMTNPDGSFAPAVVADTPTEATFDGVSCPAAGSCTAVGTAYTASGEELIADTMVGGAFGTAIPVTPPADFVPGGFETLDSVSCTAPGDCVAAGTYAPQGGGTAGMVLVETDGTFAPGVAIDLPPGGLDSSLDAVSCGSPTTCVAVGSYGTAAAVVPLVVAVVSGVAQAGQAATVPAGTVYATLAAVSCTAAAMCLAVGDAVVGARHEPFTVAADGGSFDEASVLASPADLETSASEEFDTLSGVSCASVGNCVVVGNYASLELSTQSSIYTESAGTFSAPAGVDGTEFATMQLTGVACGSGSCTIVGNENATGNVDVPPTAVSVQLVERATPDVTSTATNQSTPGIGGIADYTTVSGGSGTLGGDLVFDAFGPADATCTGSPVSRSGPVPVTGDGTYHSPTVTDLVAGTYRWVVVYTGDAANNEVVSPCGSAGVSAVHLRMGSGQFFPAAQLGAPYTTRMQASGGTAPYSYTVSSGSLPHGLRLNADGSFGGRPDDVSQANQTFAFSVSAVDANGAAGVAGYHLTVGPPPHGYWLVGSDGGIFTFGDASFYGSTGNLTLQRPVVGITPSADLGGYWLVASDGGIFSFGDGGYHGSIPGVGLHPAGSGLPNSLNAPIVGMVPSATGGGYFMVAADGGVFAFGDAKYSGSCPGIGGCSGPAVSVVPDSTGSGYWVITATGSVYSFGDARYFGSPGSTASPVTSAVSTPDGGGYWILHADGTVDHFGDASPYGSPAGQFGGADPASAIFATFDGGGYWVSSADGTVDPYGDAPFDGDMSGAQLNGPIIAATGF